MRRITEVFVHCAATRPEWMADATVEDKRDEIDRWHRERWPNGFGYHYLIDRDGSVAKGRPIEVVGAHAKGHNVNSIGVCLVGGFGSNAGDKFLDHFTTEQEDALLQLLSGLEDRFPGVVIRGHNEVAAKACPGFNVREWLDGDRRSVAVPAAVKTVERTSPTQSTTLRAGATQVATSVGAGAAAVGALDGTAQIVALVFVGIIILAAIWIMRERLQKWAEGIR